MAYACCVSCGSARMPSASSAQTPGSFARSWRNCKCVCSIAKILRVLAFACQPPALKLTVCSDELLLSRSWTVGSLQLTRRTFGSTECTRFFFLNNVLKTRCFGIIVHEHMMLLNTNTTNCHIVVVLCRDLSYNHLTRLEETAFVGLGLLESLNLGENSISHLGEGVFSGLASLRTL